MSTQVVYVQKQQNGHWLNENCYASATGFELMGFDVRGFELDTVETLKLTPKTVVHGGIISVRKAFDIIGIKQPEIHNPHIYLADFCKREISETTLGEIRNINTFPYFIKPLVDHKLFTGFVVKNKIIDLIKLSKFPDETKILKSNYVNFISEYRCFVLNKKLVGSKNYTGDFKINIDYTIVEEAINNYHNQPVAYSIDFGVTDQGETQLIEINDSFGLGSYGLNPIIYCNMILQRWDELMTVKY